MTILKKRLLCGLTALAFAVSGVGTSAGGETGLRFDLIVTAGGDLNPEMPDSDAGKNITWSLDDDGTLTISGTGKMADYFAYSEERKVPWDDKKDNIKKVIIEDGVTNIGNYAFYGYESIKSVEIGNDVTKIGQFAFCDCSGIERIVIPDSVTNIEYMAFRGCSNVISIYISKNIISIDNFAFSDCRNLSKLEFGSEEDSHMGICESTGYIGACVFYNCDNLKNVTIPSNINNIGNLAFGFVGDEYHDHYEMISDFKINCHFGVAVNGSIVSGAEEYAIKNNIDYDFVESDEEIPHGKCGDNLTWTCGKDATITISGSGSMYNFADVHSVDNRSHAPWYEIAKELYDFQYDSNNRLWKHIIIENGVTTIGDNAFSECSSLEDVSIPESVTTIGAHAFSSCSAYGFEKITIPNSVKYIGIQAFAWCWNLSDISFPNNGLIIDQEAFHETKWLENKRKENALVIVNDELIDAKTAEGDVVIPEGVRFISYSSFDDNDKVTSVTIPSSVEYIYGLYNEYVNRGTPPFRDCSNLKEFIVNADNPWYSSKDGIIYKKENENIGLFRCPPAKEIVSILDTVTWIDFYAFGDCQNLTSITIPKNVKYISFDAFYNCTNLMSVTIPASVENIGDQAFGYYLTKISEHYWGPAKLEGFKIYCYAGTAGEKYAINNGFDYELLDDANATQVLLQYTPKEGEQVPILSELTYKVYNSQNQIVHSAKADANGNIDLSGLSDGDYTIELELDGFAPRKVEYKTGEALGEIKLCRYGDDNGDGVVNLSDLGLLQQKLCDWDVSFVYDETADTNGDGLVNLNDLGLLQQYLCDWDVKLGKTS